MHRHGDLVECRGLRHGLRVHADSSGQLHVDAANMAQLQWARVDHDMVALVRAASRLLADDPDATRTLVGQAVELADVPARDLHPVTGLIRAVHPLLASPPPWPLPTLPPRIPPSLQPAFRVRDPRSAARILFGSRATRPVARAVARLLTGQPTPDLFILTVAVAAAPPGPPDHLVQLLACVGSPRVDPTPLTSAEATRLRDLLADSQPRRIVPRLAEAARDPAARARLRFVAGTCPAGIALDLRTGWDRLALHVMTATH